MTRRDTRDHLRSDLLEAPIPEPTREQLVAATAWAIRCARERGTDPREVVEALCRRDGGHETDEWGRMPSRQPWGRRKDGKGRSEGVGAARTAERASQVPDSHPDDERA